jgi:DNA-binding NtrC family response regulator
MFNAKAGRNVEGITPQTAAALAAHPWPGNVRELSNAIERAVVLSSSPVLDTTALGLEPARQNTTAKPTVPAVGEDMDLRSAIKQVEGQLIARALEKAGGNRTEAAAILGLNRTTLVEKLRKLG